jgi:hypothetical protein
VIVADVSASRLELLADPAGRHDAKDEPKDSSLDNLFSPDRLLRLDFEALTKHKVGY